MSEGRCDQIRLSLDLPPLERFNDWIRAICVITFDLELGQVIETIYPGDVELSAEEKLNTCYLSFPDSNNSSCTQDMTYHFRINQSNAQLTEAQTRLSQTAPTFLAPSLSCLYGFVHFRQKKDPTLPRGYYQKSVVILTTLPLFELFYYVIDVIAMQFFEFGEAGIEQACHFIDNWSSPEPGKTLNLTFFDSTIHGRIPLKSDVPQKQLFLTNNTSTSLHSSVLLPTMHETNCYESLKTVLTHSQLLWELVLLNEPFVVMAPTPQATSQIVQSLTSIIWPIKYSVDFRPFFTIHDSDFIQISSKINPNGIILGVTNPFFSKTLKDWPHILRIGDLNGGKLLNVEKMHVKKSHFSALDTKPGFYTSYKPFLTVDKELNKKLVNGAARPSNVQNTIVRRHFMELTQCFLGHLDRHFNTLAPKHITLFTPLPQAKPFMFDEFMQTLNETGPIMPAGIKGDFEGLYRRFLGTSNFKCWLQSRLDDLVVDLRDSHLNMLCNTDLSPANISTRRQVEVVDLVLKIRDKLADLDGKNHNDKRQKLRSQLNTLMDSVDDDLKSVLLSNGTLREAFEL